MNDRAPGHVDDTYLEEALQRAGHAAPGGPAAIEPLTGGRTGAKVLRLTCADGRRYVVKRVPLGGWRNVATGGACRGEGELWRSGVLRAHGPGCRWPVLDVLARAEPAEDWLLMEDVSAGIRPRGAFSRDDSKRLFRLMAAFHARHYQSDALRALPVPTLPQQFPLYTRPQLHLAGHTTEPPWVEGVLRDFQVMTTFLPLFLDVLGPALADAYLAMVADSSWHDELARHPSTLLHGDLRRANIAFEPDGVALLDWEIATIGPPASDLQEHCFLHYCAYPPDGSAPAIDACDDLRDVYLDALCAELGRSVDRERFRRSWSLAFVRWLCNFGFVLVDPLHPDGGSAELRAAIRAHCHAAIRHALTIVGG